MRPRSFASALVLLLGTSVPAMLALACGRTASLTESRAPTTDFDRYQSGAVEVDPRNLEGGEKSSQEMLNYLEVKLKKEGILEPLAANQGAQLIIRVRPTSSASGDDDLHLLVDFVDAKSGETIGQVTVAANALGDKSGAALRRASDEIVAYMRKHRGSPVSAKGRGSATPATLAPAAVATNRPTGAGVMSFGGCTASCVPDQTSSLTDEDQKKIVEAASTMLKDMRVCLERVSAASIDPAVILRFESSGQISQVRVDAGGYDDLQCVQDARARTPRVVVSRAASVRCDYRCAR